MKTNRIRAAYDMARDRYAELGIDTEQVMREMEDFHLSLPCLPTDDIEAMRDILLEVMHQLPGTHRVALNLSCLDDVEDWIEWGHRHHIKLDFDATLPQADTLTLAHPNNQTRAFWVDTLKRCQRRRGKGSCHHSAASISTAKRTMDLLCCRNDRSICVTIRHKMTLAEEMLSALKSTHPRQTSRKVVRIFIRSRAPKEATSRTFRTS